MPKVCFCILNSFTCITLDQTLIKTCCKKQNKTKKVTLPAAFYFYFNLAVLDIDYGENKLGAGGAEGEDSAEQL